MKTKSSLLIAFRMILPKSREFTQGKKNLLGAVLCIALSIIPLVVVMTVADGMIDGLMGRIVGLSSYHVQVKDFSTLVTDETFANLQRVATDLGQLPEVNSAFVEWSSVGLASGKKGRTGATIRALEHDSLTKNNDFAQYIQLVEGELSLRDDRAALVGKKLAEILDLKVGDTFRLITAKKNSGTQISPKITTFKVKGIVSSGYQELDGLWVLIPLNRAKTILSPQSSQIMLGVETTNPFDDSFYKTVNAIEEIVGEDYEIVPWNYLNSTQFDTFASTKLLLLFIMFLIVLIASVNVSSALVMLVMEKRKEIAILKSIGASNHGITFAFLVIGLIIGGAGVLVGIPIGLLLALHINEIISFLEKGINCVMELITVLLNRGNFTAISLLDPQYYLEHIPVVIPFTELFLIGAMALILSLLVSIVPAIKAGKEKPLEILRKT